MNIIKTLKTTLKGSLSTTGTSFTVQKFQDSKGVEVVTADFDGNFVVVLEQGSNIEMILCSAITQNGSDTSAILTIATNGRHLNPQSPWTGGSTGLLFTAGASVICTNDPYTMSRFASLDKTNTFSLKQTFTVIPESSDTPLANADLVNKAYADALVLGVLTTINLIVPATAGETVTAGALVYYDTTDKEWKLCDADTASTVENVMIAIAQGAGTDGNAITGGVMLRGLDTNQTGMTAGDIMYASNTAGEISSSAGTKEVTVGVAKTATDLYFNPRFNQMLTEDEQDALAGISGISPDSTNKFVDNVDTTVGATITASTITFGFVPREITDSGSGFLTAGFKIGDSITVSGSSSNDGTFTIKTVVAGTITLIDSDTLTFEVASATVTISSATANKVVRLKSDGSLPALDGSNLTGVGMFGGDGSDGDLVLGDIAGTGTIVSNSTAVTGTGTSFDTEVSVGDRITVGSQIQTVSSITNATNLVTEVAFDPVISTSAYGIGKTTTINVNSEPVTVKNYTSISITGGASLTVENKHTSGSILILKSQGNVTLTAIYSPMIDMSSMGADKEKHGYMLSYLLSDKGEVGGVGGYTDSGSVASVGGSGGTGYGSMPTSYMIGSKSILVAVGAGGADGGASGSAIEGFGGVGGGAIYMECAGAWNFTTTNGISVAGAKGTDGAVQGTDLVRSGAGGGGGGAGGTFIALYNILTSNTGTIAIAGGNGGAGGTSAYGSGAGGAGGDGNTGSSTGGNGSNGGKSAPNNTCSAGGAGGGGGGNYSGSNDGSNGSGSSGTCTGGGGGGGASGISYTAINTEFN